MKITDVVLKEYGYGAPGSRALGNGNFGSFVDFYRGRKTSPVLRLDFGNNDTVELSDIEVDALADYYNSLPDMNAKREFVYGAMARLDKFLSLTNKLNLNVAASTPTQPGLFERRQDVDSLDRSSAKDPKLAVALRQAYAKYPSARSDIEAFIRQEIENQTSTDQNFSSQNKTNDRQDQTIDQLRNLSRRQSQQISSLDQENDHLDDELTQLNREINDMERQLHRSADSKDTSKKTDASKSSSKDSDSSPVLGLGPNGQDRRADSKKDRAKSKEKRQDDKFEPSKTTFSPSKYSLSTPSVTPTPAPKAVAAPAAPAPDTEVPTTLGREPRVPRPETQPGTNVTHMYGIPAELPADELPASLTRDLFDPENEPNQKRTGTLGEAVRRLRELAGLK